ncbi:hypothetical protein H1P_290011 [Hyella patelloides LEGE 07179]|uniref:Uncharacterized protein n=1 Tax=Hyella patelloides LEGE 07179 TaxID=945734 RepID=A0A563VTJ9_9CYAN|nr:hypothetical protein H1P_290011 [Hyella patelloides LEGE 07179]
MTDADLRLLVNQPNLNIFIQMYTKKDKSHDIMWVCSLYLFN